MLAFVGFNRVEGSEGSQWWGMEQAARDASPFNVSSGEGLQVVVAGERLAGGSAAIAFTAGGVVAFYVCGARFESTLQQSSSFLVFNHTLASDCA